MWGYRSFAKEDVPVRETTGYRKPEMADCRTTIVRITPVNHPQQTNRIPTVGILRGKGENLEDLQFPWFYGISMCMQRRKDEHIHNSVSDQIKKKGLQGRKYSRVMEMIGDALRVNGMHLDGHRFYDYGVVLCVECGGIAEAEKIAELIRKATSRPIRQKYPELWKMPSLWNQSPCIVEGKMDPENMEKIEEYYRNLKSR